jgi:hypothetical protein
VRRLTGQPPLGYYAGMPSINTHRLAIEDRMRNFCARMPTNWGMRPGLKGLKGLYGPLVFLCVLRVPPASPLVRQPLFAGIWL